MGYGNHTLKMADTDKFPEIIDDNRKRTRLPHNLYFPVLGTTVPQTLTFALTAILTVSLLHSTMLAHVISFQSSSVYYIYNTL